MSAHTPGPWRYYDPLNENKGDEDDYFAIKSPCGPDDTPPVDLTSFMKEADARLIAAAPDLLAALHAARDFILSGDETVSRENVVVKQIYAAIAKAEAAQ